MSNRKNKTIGTLQTSKIESPPKPFQATQDRALLPTNQPGLPHRLFAALQRAPPSQSQRPTPLPELNQVKLIFSQGFVKITYNFMKNGMAKCIAMKYFNITAPHSGLLLNITSLQQSHFGFLKFSNNIEQITHRSVRRLTYYSIATSIGI